MKHIVIGTAGHIDHGKTTLVKALTGRETDTLKEEKERGISINLGFTFFDINSEKRVGIIDVPGHERFIKNMLAGVSSIDLVLFVIAADEGVMPQTREHLEILQLINIKKGIIVITKCDLVDEEWLAMIKEDIVSEFKGTFLEGAPVHQISSKTKKELDLLFKSIDKLTEDIEAKDTQGHFRLPIDRVFSISGFGTVVTGTVLSGNIKEGQTIEIYPSNIVTKVRGIQVHEENVKLAEAGERCAINLANIKVDDVKRGDVVSLQNLMEASLIIDCKFYYLKSALKPLENRQRIRLYHGTSEIMCRIILLDKEELNPGEEAYVQLRLEKPVAAQRNDRFVVRSYSPMSTIGGGTIIDPIAKKAKRFDFKYIEELKIKESGKTENIIQNTIRKLSEKYPNTLDILKALGKNEENIELELEKLIEDNKVISFGEGDKTVYVHSEFLVDKTEKLTAMLEVYHRENPLKIGVSKEELKNKVFGKGIKQKIYDEILKFLTENNKINIHGNLVSLSNFRIVYNEEQKSIRKNIINEFMISKFSPPKYSELQASQNNTKSFRIVFEALLDEEVIIKISEDCFFLKEHYDEAKEFVVQFIKSRGSISLADFKDKLNTSRKYAIALMENFDSIKLTKRLEDKRVLY